MKYWLNWFAMALHVGHGRKLGKKTSFLMSLFPIIIIKDILGRNVALTSFVGRIAIVVTKR
jgi:hypothetical protein